MATFVVAHGAWSASWAWRKMRPLMRAAGHEMVTPTLTGLGERWHLSSAAITLDTTTRKIDLPNRQPLLLTNHAETFDVQVTLPLRDAVSAIPGPDGRWDLATLAEPAPMIPDAQALGPGLTSIWVDGQQVAPLPAD